MPDDSLDLDSDLCPTCGLGAECKCEPPIITASAADYWRCEGCGRVIRDGERVYLYDDCVVAHLECPGRASA